MTSHIPKRSPRAPRGSALLLVTVLLAVLAVIGVAAVSLGSRERINASAKGTRDRMAACANAARLVIWAELAKYGSAHLRTAMDEARLTLGDGTILAAPSHYAADATDATQVISLRRFTSPLATGAAAAADVVALTNTVTPNTPLGAGTTVYAFVARCRDWDGREVEVEFTTGLMF